LAEPTDGELGRAGGAVVSDGERPNILVIWGDDIGITNLSCYSDGLMGLPDAQHRPDRRRGDAVHRLLRGAELHGRPVGVHHRAERVPHRLSKVGIPASPVGLQAEDPTIAELLKPLGYATGQFGKNHLGDLNEYLPTAHGFDEFFGNLYHLNAEEEPELPNWPPAADFPNFRDRFGPRGVLHSWATEEDDNTEEPRWGRVGHQRIEDTGPLTKKRMETIDDEILEHALDFIDRQQQAGRRSSSGSTPPTCTCGPIPSRRAWARPGAGSRPTTTP
jgi:arylsulfatase